MSIHHVVVLFAIMEDK